MNHELSHGHASLAVSLIGGIISWINGIPVGEAVKLIAGIVSIGAGIMAIRYYHYATIKAKKH